MQRDLLLVLHPEEPIILLFEFGGCVYMLFRRVGLRLIMDLWDSLPASHQMSQSYGTVIMYVAYML